MDISVVIPAYNCEGTIACLLDALKHQETKCQYEIIIVNNGSSDGTAAILDSCTKTFPVPIVVIDQPRGVTIAAVRNCGARRSNGRVLAFIDSDCLPPCHWLQQGVGYFDEHGDQILVAGGCSPPEDGTWVELAWNSVRAGHKPGSVFVHGANFFISKSLFDELGGFRENIETSEDYDLGRRVALKHKVIAVPEFSVVHYGEANTLYKKLVKERWYARHTLETFSTNRLYKPFWVSVSLWVCVVIVLVCIISKNLLLAAMASLAIISLPCLLSYYFCKRAENFTYCVQLLPICAAYIAGRSIGLLDSLLARVKLHKNSFAA